MNKKCFGAKNDGLALKLSGEIEIVKSKDLGNNAFC